MNTPEAEPAPLSHDWLALQLAEAERVQAARQSALAARAPVEYAAWWEITGVVNTLRALVALEKAAGASEQET